MTTTTEYGQIVPTTLTDWVAEALGDFVADYDVPAIVAEMRDGIQAALPDGVTLAGDQLYGPYEPRVDVDVVAVLESVDFWAIAERHDISS